MNFKFKFLTALFITMVLSTYFSSQAYSIKEFKDDSAGGEIGGVGGALAGINTSNLKGCTTDECIEIIKELTDLKEEIEEKNQKFNCLVNKVKDKKIKNEYNKKLKAIEEAEKKNQQSLQVLLQELKQTRDSLVEQAGSTNPELKELKTSLDSDAEKYNDMVNELEKLAEAAKNQPSEEESTPVEENGVDEENTDIEDNEDTIDLETEDTSYLEQGDLVAWGIPGVGIPSIPTPRPKPQKQSQVDQPDTQSESKDAVFNNIKLIEANASKITDSEKDELLNELKTQ